MRLWRGGTASAAWISLSPSAATELELRESPDSGGVADGRDGASILNVEVQAAVSDNDSSTRAGYYTS